MEMQLKQDQNDSCKEGCSKSVKAVMVAEPFNGIMCHLFHMYGCILY